MAITIESANKALTRNGLGHIKLSKAQDGGSIVLTNTSEDVILAFKDPAGEFVTRIRDLTITEVVAQGGRLAAMISERLRKDLDIATAAAITETGQQVLAHTIEKLQDAGVKIVTDVETFTNGFDAATQQMAQHAGIDLADPNTADSSVVQAYSDRRNDNVAHVDNRSKARVYPPQLVGRAVRPVTADAEVAQRNRDELQQFAKEQNEAFIVTLPNTPAGFQILRSGDLRVTVIRVNGSGPSHTWKLRDLGMRFMRDKSPAWWVDNAERLALGYLPEDAGPVMTEQRIRQHATNLQAIRDIANRSGRFAYLIVDDFGKSEAKQASDLRDAFNRINQGQRVFIHSADLKRYDRELKEGKHGQPRGALDL